MRIILKVKVKCTTTRNIMADRRKLDGINSEHSTNSNSSKTQNKFSNDGSFLEMFKKKMEEEKKRTENSIQHSSPSTSIDKDSHSVTDGDASDGQADEKTSAAVPQLKKTLPFVGKRRGAALVLKTGAVKKKKQDDDDEKRDVKKNAWAEYMDEVQKYKSQACQDEDKTRPLVK